MIEDLYDRSIVAWMIFENESDKHSRKLFDYACRKENAHPDFVHSDNTPMQKRQGKHFMLFANRNEVI